MLRLEIAPGESLYYEYDEAGTRGMTFVFVNALTGNTGMWQGGIAPALRDAGFGTLCYNFRGQVETEFGDGTGLTPKLAVDDLNRLLDHLAPPRPIPGCPLAACLRRKPSWLPRAPPAWS